MIEKLLPPWIVPAAIGGLAIVAGGAIYLLLDARDQLGAAKLQAAIDGASLSVFQQQEERNVAIDQKLSALAGSRDQIIKETVREVHIAPDDDACRKSAPMRALDGRLRYDAGRGDSRPSGAAAPSGALPAARR